MKNGKKLKKLNFAEFLKRLTANAIVQQSLVHILASSDTEESEGRQIIKKQKNTDKYRKTATGSRERISVVDPNP
jgi:hypothetical protein